MGQAHLGGTFSMTLQSHHIAGQYVAMSQHYPLPCQVLVLGITQGLLIPATGTGYWEL